MSKYTSKTSKINLPAEKVYLFLSDFNNFKNIIPADKVKDYSSTTDSCTFNISGLGQAELKMIEKEPYKLLKIASGEKTPIKFFLWIQLNPVDEAESLTAIRLTLEASLNPMMKMIIGNRMQPGLDSLLDYIVQFFNEKFSE